MLKLVKIGSLYINPANVAYIRQNGEMPKYVNVGFSGGEDGYITAYGSVDEVAKQLMDALALEPV